MLDVQLFDLHTFLPKPYEEALLPRLKKAHEKIQTGTGLGGEFTGWVHLPRTYDRAEFARIQAAARKIQSDSQALVVIGIGGSYLGARAVIELLASPNYNLKHKSTPNIYFIGNGLSSDALDEVLELCQLDGRLLPCIDFGHLYARSLGADDGAEVFARMLDKPLATFIQLYKPAYFQRVGLRYVNIFSRARLGLEGARWAELFSPAYTAPMQEAELPEDRFLNCACDLTLKLDSSCQAKVHAGPGVVKRNAPGVPQDPEVKFIFDMDLSMTGNTPCTLAAGALETLHAHSTRLFEGAITDELRTAMDPE